MNIPSSFSVRVEGEAFEEILSLQNNLRKYKPTKKQIMPKAKPFKPVGGPSSISPPVANQINMTQVDSQYATLESRVSKLETQQSALAEKVDGGFAKVSVQLQQVLEAVAGTAPNPNTRARGPQPTVENTRPKTMRVQ